MIAHRLSSIPNVDEILVIKDGEVVERGSDAELMSQPSLYQQLQVHYQEANAWEVQDA